MKRVQLIRHNTAGANGFTGKLGEITINTDTGEIRSHDNVTAGGRIVQTKIQNDAAYQAKSAELGAISALNATGGFITKLGAASYVQRTLAFDNKIFTVANPDGVAGNPSLALAPTVDFTGHTINNGTFQTGTFSGNGFGLTGVIYENGGTKNADYNLDSVIDDRKIIISTAGIFNLPSIAGIVDNYVVALKSLHGACKIMPFNIDTIDGQNNAFLIPQYEVVHLIGFKNVGWYLLSKPGTYVGEIRDYGGGAVPQGWILADGSALNRITNANLFAVYGTNWGAGDGATTFNIIEARGRSSIGTGQGTNLSNRVLGQFGGEEGHVLVEGELAQHLHGVTDNGHVHPITDPGHTHGSDRPIASKNGTTNDGAQNFSTGSNWSSIQANISVSATGITINNAKTNITINNTGGNQAHNTMHPYYVVTKMVKV